MVDLILSKLLKFSELSFPQPLKFIDNHFLTVMIPTLTQNENIYSVSSCLSTFLSLFFKSTELKFLHFNLEEKNEDRTF